MGTCDLKLVKVQILSILKFSLSTELITYYDYFWRKVQLLIELAMRALFYYYLWLFTIKIKNRNAKLQ